MAHPIVEAIAQHDLGAVKALAPSLRDPAFLTDDGYDLITFALEKNAYPIALYLVGCSLDLANSRSRFTAMQTALEHPAYEVIDRLLKRRVNLNVRGTEEDAYPLHILCRGYRDPSLLRRFLHRGADPTLLSATGQTPLDVLVELNRREKAHGGASEEMVEILERATAEYGKAKPWWRFWA